ncbi:MAG: DUF2800 domain-containing protein [Patescibacteria group bacterium]|nr:DUF2800 domain-containing protein [Patescibacteria group bacterium]
MSGEEYHARLSPSGASGWMNCPQWQSDPVGSKYADEGTAAHTLATMVLQSPGIDCDDFIGEKIRVKENSFEVTKDMAAYVQLYVDYVREEARGEGKTLYVEQDVPIGHMTGERGATGRVDAAIIDLPNRSITVVDLKYGIGERVQAENNEQGQMYTLGAIEEWSLVTDFDTARVVIYQPRISDEPSIWPVSVAQLNAFAARVTQAALRHGGDEYNPGHKQCRWCLKAKNASCAALRDEVAKAVGSEPPATAEDFAAFVPDAIDDATGDNWLAIAMSKVDMIEHWCKNTRAEVERRLLAGKTVSGWKLVQGRQGPRKWADENAAEAMLKSFRLKSDEIYDKKVISPTTTEKLLKKANPTRWNKMQELITRSEGSLSVAPESDARPAASVTATAADFAECVSAE